MLESPPRPPQPSRSPVGHHRQRRSTGCHTTRVPVARLNPYPVPAAGVRAHLQDLILSPVLQVLTPAALIRRFRKPPCLVANPHRTPFRDENVPCTGCRTPLARACGLVRHPGCRSQDVTIMPSGWPTLDLPNIRGTSDERQTRRNPASQSHVYPAKAGSARHDVARLIDSQRPGPIGPGRCRVWVRR